MFINTERQPGVGVLPGLTISHSVRFISISVCVLLRGFQNTVLAACDNRGHPVLKDVLQSKRLQRLRSTIERLLPKAVEAIARFQSGNPQEVR